MGWFHGRPCCVWGLQYTLKNMCSLLLYGDKTQYIFICRMFCALNISSDRQTSNLCGCWFLLPTITEEHYHPEFYLHDNFSAALRDRRYFKWVDLAINKSSCTWGKQNYTSFVIAGHKTEILTENTAIATEWWNVSSFLCKSNLSVIVNIIWWKVHWDNLLIFDILIMYNALWNILWNNLV